MSFHFTNLRIEKIIVHEVFQLTENREPIPPQCSSELTNLDRAGLNTLQERIVQALGNDSHSIEMFVSNSDSNSTFDINTQLLDLEKDEFIDLSKKIPEKLTQAQTSRKIPGGTVVIFSGKIGVQNYRYVGIIKAEIHSGFSLDATEGKLFLKFLTELLLTPQQKLYKIGIFIEKENNSKKDQLRIPSDFLVYVYDHNLTRNETQSAAQYFYQAFLGCSVSASDKKLTRDFFTYTKEFIESLEISDEEKLDLNSGLYTYLKVDKSSIIKASEFAERYISTDKRDEFVNYLEEKEFPLRGVSKDISYLQYKLRRRRLSFSSNVKIIAPSDNFEDLVQIKGTENSKTILSVEGHIEKED